VPLGIENCNKGNIYISKSSPPFITEAYLKQFMSDFKGFLKCRSEELVKGGKMVLTLLGRRNADPTKEKLISFNLPQYMPPNEE
ncbi:hypothetical protein MKX01_023757, partial [Papaver californicum]